MKLHCLVIDDEPVARQGLQEYVAETDFLVLAGSCENALKAAHLLNDTSIDLIYLDIHMPKVSGLEFLKTLRNPPMVILTTAYSEYAIEGYSLDVIDYLMKPITFDRFLKATQKALDMYQLKKIASEHIGTVQEYFFVKADGKYEKVNLGEILYVEALQNYVVIHTREKKLITYMTLSGLEHQLPKDRFIKVHKSFVISIEHIKSIDGNEIAVGTARIPISRNLKENVVARILGNNLFRR